MTELDAKMKEVMSAWYEARQADWIAAQQKERLEDLTEDEKFALAYAAGCPISTKMDGTMLTWYTDRLCGFYRRDGRWEIVIGLQRPHC